MGRYYIDCREHPGETKCTVALSADSKEELIDAVVQHATAVHGYPDTPEVRANLIKEFRQESHPS